MVYSHTRWDEMGWAELATQCANASIEIHSVISAAHPIPAQRVCECTIMRYKFFTYLLTYR